MRSNGRSQLKYGLFGFGIVALNVQGIRKGIQQRRRDIVHHLKVERCQFQQHNGRGASQQGGGMNQETVSGDDQRTGRTGIGRNAALQQWDLLVL